MSLISPKNFAAPFQNKVHLVSLVLAAVLFISYRLAGGGISYRDRGSDKFLGFSDSRDFIVSARDGEEGSSANSKVDLLDGHAQLQRLRERSAQQKPTADDSMDELLQPLGSRNTAPTEASKLQRDRSRSHLAEIEKELGM